MLHEKVVHRYYAHDKVTLKPFLPASDAPDSLLQEISESEHVIIRIVRRRIVPTVQDPDGEEYIFFDPEELPPSSPGADNRDIMDACSSVGGGIVEVGLGSSTQVRTFGTPCRGTLYVGVGRL